MIVSPPVYVYSPFLTLFTLPFIIDHPLLSISSINILPSLFIFLALNLLPFSEFSYSCSFAHSPSYLVLALKSPPYYPNSLFSLFYPFNPSNFLSMSPFTYIFYVSSPTVILHIILLTLLSPSFSLPSS